MCVSIEIMHRLPQATFAVRQCLLDYVVPWLYNMELVEPSVPATVFNTDSLTVGCGGCTEFNTADTDQQHVSAGVLLKGRGWGSPEATDMILNNLLYSTLTVSNTRSNTDMIPNTVHLALDFNLL